VTVSHPGADAARAKQLEASPPIFPSPRLDRLARPQTTDNAQEFFPNHFIGCQSTGGISGI